MKSPPPNERPADAKKRWFEPLVAVVMALSTLSTAWCSYQSSRWTAAAGRQVRSAESLQRQSMALHLEANQVTAIQGQMFMQWVNAHLADNEKVARFYSARFGPELERAFARWLVLKPFENAQTLPHPFVPELYEARFDAQSKQALEQSARHSETASKNTQTAAWYLSNTVLFATVLFFAATSGKFEQPRVRASTILFAVAAFIFAVIRMLILPVARF